MSDLHHHPLLVEARQQRDEEIDYLGEQAYQDRQAEEAYEAHIKQTSEDEGDES